VRPWHRPDQLEAATLLAKNPTPLSFIALKLKFLAFPMISEINLRLRHNSFQNSQPSQWPEDFYSALHRRYRDKASLPHSRQEMKLVEVSAVSGYRF
jgi:hypothetical protein